MNGRLLFSVFNIPVDRHRYVHSVAWLFSSIWRCIPHFERCSTLCYYSYFVIPIVHYYSYCIIFNIALLLILCHALYCIITHILSCSIVYYCSYCIIFNITFVLLYCKMPYIVLLLKWYYALCSVTTHIVIYSILFITHGCFGL